MFPATNLIDSFLNSNVTGGANLPDTLADGTSFSEFMGNDEHGGIDYRVRQLSYSSLLTLHTCPRKFELYKRKTKFKDAESEESNVTFAYGHVVGQGIQDLLAGLSLRETTWNLFKGWHADLFDRDDKRKKSIWEAILAVQKFYYMRENGFLSDWEVVIYNGKPACELSFCITLPDGFRLRGYVDVVLRNRITGKVLVLELKTTGAKSFSPSQFKNSAQAVGYSIVLDVLFPDISSYEVLYLIYQTGSQEYTPIEFTKSYLQRALWIKELLLDVEMIKLYEASGCYPMHGESCYDFYRDCEYINSCQMSTDILTGPMTVQDIDQKEYQINLTLLDLVNAQLSKVGE